MYRTLFVITCLLLLSGCSVGEPPGHEAYALPRPGRTLPELEAPVSTDDLLRHAFLANAALEADWHHWREALARADQAGSLSQPDLSFEYLTSSGRMRAWDRTTLEVSQTFPTAGKRGLMKDAALAEAEQARHHFEGMKFELQRQVLSDAADYAYLGKSLAAAGERLRLAERLAHLAAVRQGAGLGNLEDLLKAQLQEAEATNEIRMLEAQRPARAAGLNALLGRDADAPLPFPEEEPPAPLPGRDDNLIRLAAERNPELLGMAAEVRGRSDALELARRAWIPDLTLGYEVMGDVEASLTGMLALPLRAGRIRASIREAEAARDAARAHAASSRDGLGARLVAALAEARDADRRLALFDGTLLPQAEQLLAIAIAWCTATANYPTILETQEVVLELRLARARALAERAKAVAALEGLTAMDHGTWNPKEDPDAP